jgi:hypothetical protein
MSKIKEFTLSKRSQDAIELQIEKLAATIKSEMEIAEIDNMKISLDCDFHSTGKFVGIKYSAFKMQRLEKIYDKDIK